MLNQVLEGKERASREAFCPIEKDAGVARTKNVLRIEVHVAERYWQMQPVELAKSILDRPTELDGEAIAQLLASNRMGPLCATGDQFTKRCHTRKKLTGAKVARTRSGQLRGVRQRHHLQARQAFGGTLPMAKFRPRG